jgi:hypothetical protein
MVSGTFLPRTPWGPPHTAGGRWGRQVFPSGIRRAVKDAVRGAETVTPLTCHALMMPARVCLMPIRIRCRDKMPPSERQA